MKNQRILLIIIICLPALFLSGCWDVDEEILEIVVESWAEHNGLINDGKVSPIPIVQKVAEDTIRDFTNDKPFIQLDGLEVIRDIERAEQLADEAMVNLDTAKMSAAVSIRPHDWTLQEKDAAVWLAHGNAAAAQTAFSRSDDILLESVANGENCIQLRQHQLKVRRDTILDATKTCRYDPNCSESEKAVLWKQWQAVNNLRGHEFKTQSSDVCPDN